MKPRRQATRFRWLNQQYREIRLPMTMKCLIALAILSLVCSSVLATEDRSNSHQTKPNSHLNQQSASSSNQKRKPQQQNKPITSAHQKLILERMLALASGTTTAANTHDNNTSSSSAASVQVPNNNKKRMSQSENNATVSARNDAEIETLEQPRRFLQGPLMPPAVQEQPTQPPPPNQPQPPARPPQRPPLRSRMVPNTESVMSQMMTREFREQHDNQVLQEDFSGFGEQAREQPVPPVLVQQPSLPEPPQQQQLPVALQTASRQLHHHSQPSEVALLPTQHNQNQNNEDERFDASGFNHRFGAQSVAPVEPAAPLLTPFASGSEKRSSQIKVVFNNNPQFIIGREHTHHGTSGDPFQTRGSNRRTTTVNLQDPDHDSDESSPDATKVLVHHEPCDKGKHHHHSKQGPDATPNIEQIDLNNPPEPQVPEQPPVRPISPLPPPPPPKTVPPVQQHADEQQVDTPFDEIVKSGMRPPLRMVISMRNKDGDTMKVPINLRGANKKQPATFDLGPQMQIHFEPPEIIEQQQQKQQQPIDENTPIGGDVFDPNIVKPFSKTSKAPEPLPLPPILPPPPPPPQPKSKTQFPEKAPVRPPRKQPPVITPEVKTVTAPPVVQHPVQMQVPVQVPVQVPQVVEEQAPIETPPPPPPPTKVEPPVQSPIDVPPPPPAQPAQPQVPIQVPQVKEEFPRQQIDQHPIEEHHDCHHHHHHHHHEKHDEQQQQHISDELPDFVTQDQQQQSDIGLARLMGPAFGAMNNKTFADMFAQFQRALADQMQLGQQRQATTVSPQVDNLRLDDQEDLMVAMMAANLSASNQPKQVSMTVITPPRGTSLADAIRVHADPTQGDPSRTVAILQTRRNNADRQGQQPRQSQSGPSRNSALGIETEGGNSNARGNSIAVEVQLRPGGNPNPNPNIGPESADAAPDAADLEGFASSGANLRFANQHQRRRRKPTSLDRLSSEIKFRFKRSSAQYDRHLEPGDRLVAQPNFERNRQFFGSRISADQSAKVKPSDDRPGNKDIFVASESARQNEVPLDESDEADEDSGDLDEDSSASNASPREVDLDEEMGDEPGDDSPANFDADDEPYNQGASSDRDYNSPTSFEIPQIDINPDALKQKGCRTVLREVQEIPMNGLGVVRADGRSGSGYGSDQRQGAGRFRRSAGRNNDNLINSRKVTSIVMTKECHFPNEPAGAQPRTNQRVQPVQHQQPNDNRRQQVQHQVGPVALGSAMKPHLVTEMPKVEKAALPNIDKGPVNQAATVQEQAMKGAQQSQPQLETSASKIRRRSVAQQQPPASKLSPPAKSSLLPDSGGLTTAASKRDEVVAQKYYKPPSDEDPYHTLSYSSKNGADPDMDQDEDDNSVMSPDNDSDATPQRMEHRDRDPRRGSKPQETRMSETERRALLDPDHEDTDPVSASSRQEAEEPEFQSAPDADENDESIDEPPPPSRALQGGSKKPQPVEKKAVRKAPQGDRRPGYDATRRRSQPEDLPPSERFGKSFKFEHSVSRPHEQRGLASQLRQLSPGRQTFSQVEGDGFDRRAERPLIKPANVHPPTHRSQPVRAQPNQRLEPEEAREDEAEDEENDEAEPSRRRKPAASHRQAQATRAGADPQSSPAEDPDEDPDYNPSEGQVPVNGKPKKVEKSFAYVHRDVPQKNAKNPDDFVVSYGRGNLQTEHEDYDSDREPASNAAPAESQSPGAEVSPSADSRAKRRARDNRIAANQWHTSHNPEAYPENWPVQQQVRYEPGLMAAQRNQPYNGQFVASPSVRQAAAQHYYPFRQPGSYVG